MTDRWRRRHRCVAAASPPGGRRTAV